MTSGKNGLFIGRDREIADLAELLRSERLVTVAGTAGVGKSRLAHELTTHVRRSFTSVVVVDLAAVADPCRVADTVANAVGAEPRHSEPIVDTVVRRLVAGRPLLVLDTCEHVVDAVAVLVETLLRRCPRLVLLATSRELLRVAGEAVYRLDGLSVPDSARGASVAALLRADAVRLFVDRAGPEFQLTEDNADTVAELCAAFEGLPLAVELAATLAPRLLVTWTLPGLRAAIDWSYDLLTPVEQAAFRRLSVLADSFGLDAAEAVCADLDCSVLELVVLLEAKSLLHPHPRGAARFRMLDTIRHYGRDRLAACDEELATRERLAGWLAELARQLIDRPSHELRQRLVAERENLWNEVDRVDGEQHLLLACAVHLTASSARANVVLARALDVTDADSRYRGYALMRAAWSADWVAEPAAPLTLGLEALRLERRWNRPEMLLRLHRTVAMGYCVLGDTRASVRRLRDAERIARSLGDDFSVAAVLQSLVWIQICTGEADSAAEGVADMLAAARASDDPEALWESLFGAGAVAVARGDLTLARTRFAESVRLGWTDWPRVHRAIEGLGLVAVRSGRTERGLLLLTAAQGRKVTDVLRGCGTWWEDQVGDGIRGARRALPTGRADTVIKTARAVDLPALVRFALDDTANRLSEAADGVPFPLSQREWQAGKLLVLGLSNAQIAGRLGTSARTVETQLRSARRKLGVGSRAEVAVWVAGRLGS